MAAHKGCFIECFGMPGVGKSQVARSLVQVLRDGGVRVQDDGLRLEVAPRWKRIVRKVWYIIPCSARMIKHFSGALRARHRHDHSRYRRLKILFNWAYVVSLLRVQLQRDGIPVLDQGILQALWSTEFHSREGLGRQMQLRRCVEDVLAFLGDPRIIVLTVEANERRVRERIQGRRRGGSPLDAGGHLTTEAWDLARSATSSILDLVDWLSNRHPSSRFIRIDNDREDPTGVALEARLARHVLPLLADLGGGASIAGSEVDFPEDGRPDPEK